MASLLTLMVFGADEVGRMSDSYQFRVPAVVAVVTLYAAALCLGSDADGLIGRARVSGPSVWAIGVGLAWGGLLLSAFAGSAVNFIGEMRNEPSVTDAFTDWMFKPMLWATSFGWLPAAGLDLLHAARVKKALSRS